MLDIRLLREQPDEVKTRLLTRDSDSHALVDKVLACDQVRRQCETERQQLQQERNTVSKEIGKLRKNGQDTSEIEASVKKIGESIKSLDEKVLEAETTQRDLLLSIPNLPHEACPVGQDESANPEVRVWGEKPVGEFKDHVTLGAELGLFDFEAGATLSGSGYVVFTGPGARLERALIQFLLDLQTDQHGYTEVSPPIVVRRECMFGTGQLPKFTAYTPCFRREAGSAGRESKGLIRMHQFDKVELVQIVHPDQSMTALEELTGHAEKALQLLGLHYRVIELCTGDLGRSSSKTYDLEVWAPGHGGYLEVSSCSAFMDYQARRMQLRYKDAETKKNHFCHTLNGSGLALPRLFVALVETWQQPDGSIKLPEPLHPYFGGATEIR
ncbi:MAG: serine--tRNA ligase [Verrucomicrobiales bacterium]